MRMISRIRDQESILQSLQSFPIVALLGPRQCGKTTLAQQIKADHYFDLENPRDLVRFDQPQLTLENLKGTIVIDEVQRKPELFSLLRYLVDQKLDQKYLILGSASRDLIQQGSESLAGRIAFFYLSGFTLEEVGPEQKNQLWLRGGYPRSFLTENEEMSFLWRENYIRTFLERDIPQLGIQLASETLRRFWIMLSHYHGQILNYSEIARSFGVSDVTVKKYIDILKGTFMIRLLQPWFNNTGKRLVKSPKLYLCDSGLFHSLQSIKSWNDLTSHPKLGASWEGFCVEMIMRSLKVLPENFFFWSVHQGSEVDLFWRDHGKNWGIEIKYADAPSLTRSIKTAVKDLNLEHLWIIYPGSERYLLEKKVTVIPLSQCSHLKEYEIYPNSRAFSNNCRPAGE